LPKDAIRVVEKGEDAVDGAEQAAYRVKLGAESTEQVQAAKDEKKRQSEESKHVKDVSRSEGNKHQREVAKALVSSEVLQRRLVWVQVFYDQRANSQRARCSCLSLQRCGGSINELLRKRMYTASTDKPMYKDLWFASTPGSIQDSPNEDAEDSPSEDCRL
jgi:hypothetical protein